jgi:hypothetical protein
MSGHDRYEGIAAQATKPASTRHHFTRRTIVRVSPPRMREPSGLFSTRQWGARENLTDWRPGRHVARTKPHSSARRPCPQHAATLAHGHPSVRRPRGCAIGGGRQPARLLCSSSGRLRFYVQATERGGGRVCFGRVETTARYRRCGRSKGGPMPRRLFLLSLLTLLLLAPASTAWARGGGWEPLNNQPFTLEACGTTVDVTYPMDKEYQRVTTDARATSTSRSPARSGRPSLTPPPAARSPTTCPDLEIRSPTPTATSCSTPPDATSSSSAPSRSR